ncbi:MAG: hypothetical protein ACE5HB_05560 [Terriglobia bacterium]
MWDKKPAGEWTVEEALQVVQDSPWARTVTLLDPSIRGERLARLAPRNRGSSVPPDYPLVHYLVRWESARPVAEAFARLEELGETTGAQFQSPAPRQPADRYVVTVKTTRPPRDGGDLFDGFGEDELAERAELKCNGVTVGAAEARPSGVGANAAVHFFFPRRHEDEPLLQKQREKVEFSFRGRRFTLKRKFTLESRWLD